MPDETSFGRSLLTASSANELLELERAAGRSSPLQDVDAIVERLVSAAFQHTARTVTTFERGKDVFVRLESLSATERGVVERQLAVSSLNQRGAWFLPEEVTLRTGLVNLPSYFRSAPRYAHNMAADDRLRTALTQNADAVLVWAILEPLFEILLRPLDLFGVRGLATIPDTRTTTFDESVAFLTWAGLASENVVGPLRADPPQFGLRANDVLERKLAFLSAIHANLTRGIGQLFRAHLVKVLASQYYAKAKKDGRAKRKQVVTKALTNEFVAAFLGDWPAFVAYLGEELHPDERIVTSLPEPTLQVTSRSRVAQVAAERGIPVEEVERMAASLWGTGNQESPIHERVQALNGFWQAFDTAHAAQESGMKSLWGLVDETSAHQFVREEVGPYEAHKYLEHLPQALCNDVDRLWGTTLLNKYPERVVSEPFPHSRMAEVFGPALKFWNGCALTTWFFCEGPSSRTDLKGLQHYQRDELAQLEALGCPVHPQLFEELIAAERKLGPEEPIEHDSIDVGTSFKITMSMGGSRRRGFAILRDIVTRYRRWWAEHYLASYIEQAWRTPLRDVTQRMTLETTERGKPPTLKQFAKHAVPVAAAWFGGDMGMLYAAMGQKASFTVERRRLMPTDVGNFIRHVLQGLGPRIARLSTSLEAQRIPEYLAVQAPYYVQLFEALNRVPTSKDLGESKLSWMATNLQIGAEAVFAQLAEAVADELERRSA